MALAALGDGTKLMPFIIFKGRRRNKDADKVTGVVVEYTDNGWMNKEKTLRWLQVIWRRRHDQQRRLLCWDSYKCHLTVPVVGSLNERKTDAVIVPGGTTSILQVSVYTIINAMVEVLTTFEYVLMPWLITILQAPDVCWNKPFKGHYQDL